MHVIVDCEGQVLANAEESKMWRTWVAVLVAGTLCIQVCGVTMEAAGATPQELTVMLPGGVPLEMVWIPPGTFTMGTTAQQKAYIDSLSSGDWGLHRIDRYDPFEFPAHQVTISRGFYLGKYEVTQAQWKAVMGTTPWSEAGEVSPDAPASNVTWLAVVRGFIAKLNAAGDSLYRLPAEAEWEYACRAGTETLWYFGDNPMLFDDARTRQRANPWGLYDMYGGVGEWVLDWRREYTEEPQVDPVGPRAGTPGTTQAIFRGSMEHDFGESLSWQIWHSRSASRAWHIINLAPYLAPRGLGFRLLREQGVASAVEESSWGSIKAKR